MFGLKTLVPLCTTAILLMVPAEATTTYYAGSSAESPFNTAVGGLTLLDPALTFSSGDLSPGVGILNASGTGIDFLGFDTAYSGCCGPLGFTMIAGKPTATNAGEVVQINFPAAGVYAFGIHVATTSSSGNWCIDFTPTLPGACAYNFIDTSSSDQQFFGFVSNAPVNASLYLHPLNGGSPVLVLPDFEAFGPSQVPEPRTMLLVGLGLLILPLIRRKRNSRTWRRPAAGPSR